MTDLRRTHAKSPAGRTLRRHLVAWSVTLLFLALPALVGLAGVASPPRSTERELLGALTTARKPDEARSDLVRLYALAWVDATAEQRWHQSGTGPDEEPVASQAVWSQARLVNLVAWFAIAVLLYVIMATARHRIPAIGSCVGLAATGPVLDAGAFLRPEVPATLFGTLGIAIAAGLPVFLRRFRGLHPQRGAVWALLLPTLLAGSVIGVAFGLACSCVPRAGVYLLVPGGVLILATAVLLPGTMRLLRRVTPRRLPVVAWRWRILPWAIVSVGGLGWVVFVLRVGVQGAPDALRSTPMQEGLLPQAWWMLVPLVALAAIGGVALVIGVGLRLGRARRVTPDLVLLVWILALLAQSSLASNRDVTMAAPALAALFGEGLSWLALFAAGSAQTATLARVGVVS